MVDKRFIHDNRKTILCIDSYEEGVMQGRFFCGDQPAESFRSLSQFLVKMDALLDQTQLPQAYTTMRSFSSFLLPDQNCSRSHSTPKGTKATFELQILFRQHSSWQGILVWQNRNMEQSFRSVLELILLIDSALRGMEGLEAG